MACYYCLLFKLNQLLKQHNQTKNEISTSRSHPFNISHSQICQTAKRFQNLHTYVQARDNKKRMIAFGPLGGLKFQYESKKIILSIVFR